MSVRLILAAMFLLVAAGGGAAAYLGPALLDGAARAEAKRQAAREYRIRASLARHIETLDHPPLVSAVPGRRVGERIWDFRAAAPRGEDMTAPAYGRAALHCDDAFAREGCWTLIRLMIDGEMRLQLDDAAVADAVARRLETTASKKDAAPAETSQKETDAPEPAAPAPKAAADQAEAAKTGAPAASATPAAAPRAPEKPETADASDSEAAAEIAEGAEPGADPEPQTAATPPADAPTQTALAGDAAQQQAQIEPDPASAETAETAVATHVVRVSEVNARSAPGKNGAVLAIVSRDQPLEQIGARGSWGRYRVLGGDHNGAEVYIYDRLVSAIE